ncbi:hypothetical protein HRbin36_00127 [bacterium HR36]|nr:hypothetical protein HRbin36_00127 [bacterium HR36]
MPLFWSSRYKVKSFNSEMIGEYLRRHDIKFLRGRDGEFIALFQIDPRLPGECLHIVLHTSQQIYVMLALLPAAILPRNRSPVEVANNWNVEKRWPRAYYSNDHGLILDWQLDFTPGICQALVDHFTSIFLAGVALCAQELYNASR